MIFKIIIPRSVFNKDKDNLKLVFIGNIDKLKIQNPKKLYEIIRKIESQGIEYLTSEESTFINNIYPNFKKIIGLTNNYMTKFIYQTIPENINIRSLNIFIIDTLLQMKTIYPELDISFTSFKKTGIIPYYYSLPIKKQHIERVINFIFQINGFKNKITHKKFCNSLTKIIGIKLPFNNLLDNMNHLELGSEPYNIATPIEYLNNTKLRIIINSQVPNLLCFYKVKKIITYLEEDKIKLEDIIYNYENICKYYANEDNLSNILKNLSSINLDYESMFINLDNINQELVLNLSTIKDNILYCYILDDIIESKESASISKNDTQLTLSNDVERFLIESSFKIKNSSGLNNITNESMFWLSVFANRNQFLLDYNYINNTREIDKNEKTMDFMININKQYWNKLTFSGYLNQPGLKINLPILFKESIVSFYSPVIKYITNGEIVNYNVYLPFLKTIDSKIAKKYFNNVDILEQLNEKIYSNNIFIDMKKVKYNKYSSYLLYKVLLDIEDPFLCLNIFVFETCFVIMNIDNSNNITISQEMIEKAFRFLNLIIKKIKTIFNIKKLEFLNPESSLLINSYIKNKKNYESINIIEQHTNLDINLNFKSYFIFQKFVKKIVESKKFNESIITQLLDISSIEYQKDFYLFITRNKLKNGKNILPLLNDIISRNPNFKKSFMTDNEIRYIYTQIHGFNDKSNIIQYMFNRITKIKGGLNKTKELELIKETATLFNKTVEEIQNIFKTLLKLEIQGHQNFHYFMSFTIKNDQENKCFNLKFQGNYNLDIITAILEHIGYSFNQLFTEIINEDYPSLVYNLDILKNINDIDIYNDKFLNEIKDIDTYLNDIINNNKVLNSIFNITEIKKPITNNTENVKSTKLEIKQQNITNMDMDINLNMDMDFDIENMDFDIENMDLDIDMDMDLDLDIDMDIIQDLEIINKDNKDITKDITKDINKENKDVNKENLNVKKMEVKDLEIRGIVGKNKKLSESEYINLMRRKYDPELYEPSVDNKQGRFKADRHCPQTDKRVPMIVTKEQLETFDPKSFNGYMKYRENYYICPRLWDSKAEKPISIEEFIKNGLRSPYSDGELITNGPSKKLITDKYNVILRKPTTNKYWSEPTIHEDWPSELKHTEREAYPALTKVSTHPKNLCLPCCRLNKPDEFDPYKKEIQEITKPQGYNQCKDTIELKNTKNKVIEDKDFIKYENYVSNQLSQLKSSRLGLLPNNIDILLNNLQNVFLTDNENTLIDNTNVLLRCGLTNNKEYNILESVSQCLEISISNLVNNIINKLEPEDFLMLNNGSLVDEFYIGSFNYIPNNEKELLKFIKFCNYYNNIFDNYQINKDLFLKSLNDFSEFINYSSKTNIYYSNFQSNLKFLYKVYVSFYNYLKFLNSNTEIKRLHHVLDLFIVPRKWLFKTGLNIIIFNKDKTSIKCGYDLNEKSNKLLLLIEEEDNIYIPIIQVKIQNQSRVIRKYILDINDSINISDKIIEGLNIKKPQYKKSFSLLKERLEAVIKLLYIKKQVCNFNLSVVNNKILEFIKRNKIYINKQYFNFSDSSGQIDFINISRIINIHKKNNTSYDKNDKSIKLNNKSNYKNDKSNYKNDINSDSEDDNTDEDEMNNYDKKILNDDLLTIILPVYKNKLLHYNIADYSILMNDIKKLKLNINTLCKYIYNFCIIKNINNYKIQTNEGINYYSFADLFGYNFQTINIERLSNKLYITALYFTNGLLLPLLPTEFIKEEYNLLFNYLYDTYKIKLNISNNIIINTLKLKLLGLSNNLISNINNNSHNSHNDKNINNNNDNNDYNKNNNIILDDKLNTLTIINDKNNKLNNKENELINIRMDLYSNCVDTLENSLISIISNVLYKNRKNEEVKKLYNLFKFNIIDENYIEYENNNSKDKDDGIKDKNNNSKDKDDGIKDKDNGIKDNVKKIDKPSLLLFTNINIIIKNLVKICEDLVGIKLVENIEDDILNKLVNNIIDDNENYEIVNFKTRVNYMIRLMLNNISSMINTAKKIEIKINNKKTKYNFEVLDKVIYLIITNIIQKLIIDVGFRYNFFEGKILDLSFYDGVYFDNVINKDIYNKEIKDYVNNNNLGIICSPIELNFIIKNNLISRYKKSYNIVLDNIETYFNTNKKQLTKYEIDLFNSKLNLSLLKGSTSLKRLLNFDNLEELTSLTSSRLISKNEKKIIISTIFNSKGLYNPNAQVSECKFPYRNIRGKLSYNCNPASLLFAKNLLKKKNLKESDLICPTSIDKVNKPLEFGYCPENPMITEERFNVKKVYAKISGDKYINCQFPYLFFNKKIINPLTGTTPLIRINFNTFKKRKEEGNWCFTSEQNQIISKELDVNGLNDLNTISKTNDKKTKFLVGTNKLKDIYYGKWSMDNILDERNRTQIDKKKIKNFYDILNYKEVKCIDSKKQKDKQNIIEEKLNLNNIKTLTIDEYDHSFCMLSESKKGYTKKQLYVFGRDILKIHYDIMINKNGNILSKKLLCKLFEPEIKKINKYKLLKNLKLNEDDLDLTKIYKKDPDKCNEGEGKGGYKALKLREIATTFLGLKFDDAFKMKKEELCNFIIPRIFKEYDTSPINTNNESTNKSSKTSKNDIIDYENIYPKNKDINLCEKPINRGGISITKVRNIARLLNIEFKERLKLDICNDIRSKIENIKANPSDIKTLKFKDDLKLNDNISSIKENIKNKEFII